jgi:hypothetical protein
MLNIVFGSLKTTAAANSAESEFGFASMKLEANRGPKTSRRILFNREAGALLRLPKGAVQKLLFGFAQPTTPDESPRLFVINTDEFLHETKDTTYNTSKNESSFTDSKEKGKAISSTKLSTEIRTFLGMDDDSQDINFSISLYSDEGEADIYELSVCSNIEEDTIVDTVEETYETINEVNDIEVVDEEVIVVDEEEIPVVSSGFNVPM